MVVADRGPYERQTDIFQASLQPDIAHDRCDHPWEREPAVFLPALSDDCEDLVAIDQVALFIHHNDPIGIAVERYSDIGAHLPPHRPRASTRFYGRLTRDSTLG
jgi:hypothetical protein